MEQLSLFAVDTDDLSNVDLWGADEFVRFLKNGDSDGFKEAMQAKGFHDSVTHGVMRAGEKQWQGIMETALKLMETAYGSFTFGSSQKAVETNLQHPLVKEIAKSNKNMAMHEALNPLLRDHAEKWIGSKLWRMASFSSYDSAEQWVQRVANACRFVELTQELQAQEVKPSDVRLGDEVICYWHGTTYRGWIVQGEITRWKNEQESLEFKLWVQEMKEQGNSWETQAFSDYQDLFSRNELTKQLTARYIRTFYHEERLYRVGHLDDIQSYQPTKEAVREALFSLPLPETPEKLWEIAKGHRENWLETFFGEETNEWWHECMKRYSPEDSIRVLTNASCKPSRRGSWLDHLPPDEMIEPMIQKFMDAETFEEIEDILQTHYWVSAYEFDGQDDRCGLHTIGYNCSCYDHLHKSTLAQTRDRDLILWIMRDYAMNPHMRPNVARYTHQNGLEMIPFEDGMTDEQKEQRIKDFEKVQSMTFLGVFDMSVNRKKAREEAAEEDNIIDDEDESDEDDNQCWSCQLEDEDEDEE